MDELAQLRQRLYQARTEDKIQKMLMAAFKPKEEELDTAYIEEKGDTDMDKPVDPQRFEAAKVMRNKLADECVAFVQKFKKVHKRDPLPKDLDEIRGTINDFVFQQKKYALLKAKMVR